MSLRLGGTTLLPARTRLVVLRLTVADLVILVLFLFGGVSALGAGTSFPLHLARRGPPLSSPPVLGVRLPRHWQLCVATFLIA